MHEVSIRNCESGARTACAAGYLTKAESIKNWGGRGGQTGYVGLAGEEGRRAGSAASGGAEGTAGASHVSRLGVEFSREYVTI